MNFDAVLNDIQKLIGLKLGAVNMSTGHIEIVSINFEKNNFRVKLNDATAQSRPISELQEIWERLSKDEVVNVETVLEGKGSSRHIPETILANLPYIEHFKYKFRKHLFLNTKDEHNLGTIKEISSKNLKIVRKRLDSYGIFDRTKFAKELRENIQLLDVAVEQLRTKFPSEFEEELISSAQRKLIELSVQIANTVPENFNNQYLTTELSPSDLEQLEDEDEDDEKDSQDLDSNDDGVDKSTGALKGILASKIRSIPLTISTIYDRIIHNEIELQPDFQRKDRIWNNKAKSKLIESILIGLPIPTFYFAERNSNVFIVVDGLQRITTFFDFMMGKFKLEGLKYRKELHECEFKDLPRPDQRKIREYQLHAYVITIEKNNDEMVRELFQRINTYGLKMSNQEIRCALYPGSSIKFIRHIAEHKSFLDVTSGKIKPPRMRDLEFVLGAVAFALFGHKNYKENKFDDFLTNSMVALNKLPLRVLHKNHPTSGELMMYSIKNSLDSRSHDLYVDLADRMDKSFELSVDVFGADRFKKEKDGRVINKPIFEMVTSTFMLLNDGQREKLKSRKIDVYNSMFDLLSGDLEPPINWSSEVYENRPFEYSVSQSTGKRVTILYRFGNFQALLQKILGEEISFRGIIAEYDSEYNIKKH